MPRTENVRVETEQDLARLIYTLGRIQRKKNLPYYYLEPYHLLVEPVLARVPDTLEALPTLVGYSVGIPRKLYRALLEDIEKAHGIRMVLNGEHPITEQGIRLLERYEAEEEQQSQ